jgi:hypothetical protein
MFCNHLANLLQKDSINRNSALPYFVIIWPTFYKKIASIETSRRQLTPILDKPAFSRIHRNLEPRIVVEIFGKFVKKQVCPKWGELPTVTADRNSASHSGEHAATK